MFYPDLTYGVALLADAVFISLVGALVLRKDPRFHTNQLMFVAMLFFGLNLGVESSLYILQIILVRAV